MRSRARCSGCSSAAATFSNGSPPRRPRQAPRLGCRILTAAWAARLLGGLAASASGRLGARDTGRVAVPFVVALVGLAGDRAAGQPLSPVTPGRRPAVARRRARVAAIARRTWRFFETFVTPADNMLPPDNFQEDPNAGRGASRHRRRISACTCCQRRSARDFGWIGTLDAVERLEATLPRWSSSQRFRGHFFNWYDTRTFAALEPQYVSSVDSGNLAGHLIALANACGEWSEHAPFDVERLRRQSRTAWNWRASRSSASSSEATRGTADATTT